MAHSHIPTEKIWSESKKKWLYGKYCVICGKDLSKKPNIKQKFEYK